MELFFSKAAERRPEMLVKRALPGVILIITAILIITVREISFKQKFEVN